MAVYRCGKTVGSAERNIIQLLSITYLRQHFNMVYSRSTHQLIVIRGKETNRFYVFGVRDDYMLVRALYCPVFCNRREAVVQLQPGRAGVLVQQRVDTACRRKGEGTAQKELKNLSDETGMFGRITDEQIQQNAGVMYSDAQVLHDPLAGISALMDGGAESEILIMWAGLVMWAGPVAEGIRQADRENYESLWADNT